MSILNICSEALKGAAVTLKVLGSSLSTNFSMQNVVNYFQKREDTSTKVNIAFSISASVVTVVTTLITRGFSMCRKGGAPTPALPVAETEIDCYYDSPHDEDAHEEISSAEDGDLNTSRTRTTTLTYRELQKEAEQTCYYRLMVSLGISSMVFSSLGGGYLGAVKASEFIFELYDPSIQTHRDCINHINADFSRKFTVQTISWAISAGCAWSYYRFNLHKVQKYARDYLYPPDEMKTIHRNLSTRSKRSIQLLCALNVIGGGFFGYFTTSNALHSLNDVFFDPLTGKHGFLSDEVVTMLTCVSLISLITTTTLTSMPAAYKFMNRILHGETNTDRTIRHLSNRKKATYLLGMILGSIDSVNSGFGVFVSVVERFKKLFDLDPYSAEVITTAAFFGLLNCGYNLTFSVYIALQDLLHPEHHPDREAINAGHHSRSDDVFTSHDAIAYGSTDDNDSRQNDSAAAAASASVTPRGDRSPRGRGFFDRDLHISIPTPPIPTTSANIAYGIVNRSTE